MDFETETSAQSRRTIANTIWKQFLEHEFTNLLYVFAVTVSIGTTFYHFAEKWRWLDSLYFSVAALTTVGFGDFSPKTDIGKIFTMFYTLIGIGIVLGLIDSIAHYTKRKPRNRDQNTPQAHHTDSRLIA